MEKPPPPKFELPPEDWWRQLTDEDREFLAEAQRNGSLSHMTYEWALAEIEAARKRALGRIKGGELGPDDPNDSTK